MKCLWLVLALTATLTVEEQYQGSVQQRMDKQFDVFRQTVYAGLLGIRNTSKRRISIVRQKTAMEKFQDIVPEGTPFPCDTRPGAPGARSPTRPTSVHRLRPGDIDVVGALGDSLSTGNGAGSANLLQVIIEFRGIAWSAGGEATWREFLTLPNILKEFNPSLVGYSLGVSIGSRKESQFNVAEPIGMTKDLVFQAKLFERRMKADKRVNFEKDWKLLTIQVGHNDFCSFMCYQNWTVLHDNFRTDLMAGLDYLHDNIPRLLVNLVPPIGMGKLLEQSNFTTLCELIRILSCTCFLSSRWKPHREEFLNVIERCHKVYYEVVQNERYSDKEDFAVVLQPFMFQASLMRTTDNGKVLDLSYFAMDCFHPSQKGHALAANALWNNMLEPVGNKTAGLPNEGPFTKFLCPTFEHPYIYTRKNSRPMERTASVETTPK